MTTLSSTTRERWLSLAARFGAENAAEPLFNILDALYAHPARPYHNLAHIEACLMLLDRYRELTTRPDAVELALWLHDCIYIPGRKDNEERSAQVAGMFAREMGIDPRTASDIQAWILGTRHTSPPTTPDEALLLDIDMSILAAPAEKYDAYVRAIRSEFSFATDKQFRAGRGAFLRSLLTHPAIFFTPVLHEAFEAPARVNVVRELASLESELDA